MDKDINFDNYEDSGDHEDRDDYEENFLEEESDQPESSPEDTLIGNILVDDCSKFVAMINDGFTSPNFNHPQDFIYDVCRRGSVGCATALIKGETCLTVDINSPCKQSSIKFPLHAAALSGSPSITELLLVNSARTGVRCHDHECFTLPLHLALLALEFSVLQQWSPKNSIKQLLFSLCVPDKQNALENVGLLVWTTKHLEEEFLRYVENGKVVEVAALLMVAWKRLRVLAITARSMLTQKEVLVSRDIKTSMLQLFEIFESAGDDLEAHVKIPKLFVCKRRAIYAVKCLLQRKGIHVDHEETDLSYLDGRCGNYFSQEQDNFDFAARWPHDFFMEHYGKSGYRWIYHPHLRKIGQILRVPSSPNAENTNSPTIDQATTLNSKSATDLSVEALNKVKGWMFNLSNVVSRKSWASFASVRKLLK